MSVIKLNKLYTDSDCLCDCHLVSSVDIIGFHCFGPGCCGKEGELFVEIPVNHKLDMLIHFLAASVEYDDRIIPFNQLLNKTIELTGLTDEQIATRWDASKPTIAHWKAGLSTPNMNLLTPFCEWMLDLAIAVDGRYIRA